MGAVIEFMNLGYIDHTFLKKSLLKKSLFYIQNQLIKNLCQPQNDNSLQSYEQK